MARQPRRARARRARAPRARRGNRARRGVPRSLVSALPQSHDYKRTAYFATALTVGSTAEVYGAYSFQLSSLANASEYTVLYDMYKISAVKWTLMPRGNSAEAGTNNNNTKVLSVLDMDDDDVPTSVDQLCQYESVKTTNLSRDHSRYIKPKFARMIYKTSTTTGYGVGSGWLDCNSTDIPHYGIKYCLLRTTSGTVTYDLKVTYYLSFKGVR